MAITQWMITEGCYERNYVNFTYSRIGHNFNLHTHVLGNHDNLEVVITGNNGDSIALSWYAIVRNTRIELRFYCIAYCIAIYQVTNSNYLVLHSGHLPFILSAGLRPDCMKYRTVCSYASRKFAHTIHADTSISAIYSSIVMYRTRNS